jgi:hypothetical protein
MKRHTTRDFSPLRLVVNGGEIVLRTISDAAETLLTAWPADDGEEYMVAVRTCLDALYDIVPTVDVREALIRAAEEDDIPCFSFVG